MLQVRRTVERVEGVGEHDSLSTMPWTAWEDAAIIDVPARSRREVAIRKAITQAGLTADEPLEVRLLNVDAARVSRVTVEPPAEPRLRIE